MVHLLSYPGTKPDQKDGYFGKIMHGTGKWMMRAAIMRIHKHYMPVIEKKRAEGWHKDHVKALDKYWMNIINIFDDPINAKIGGFRSKDDPNRQIFIALNDIFLCMMDEDTFYELPTLLYLKSIHENWSIFEQQAAQAYNLLDFGNIYREILEYNKELEDITDEEDMIDELDLLANSDQDYNKTLKDGKIWNGQKWVDKNGNSE
jgi:hypothetical protein